MDDDDEDDNFKIESAQPVSDTFCEPILELSQKLQLEHHQCIRLFTVMEPCLWTFRDENGVIHALCFVYVDDFMLACSDSPLGKHVFESINNLYEWGKWSHECSNNVVHRSLKPTTNTLKHGADVRSASQKT